VARSGWRQDRRAAARLRLAIRIRIPNLATVPARPAATNTAAWNQMTAGLITDRLNALQAAAIAPIPAASATAPTASALTSSQPPAASASLGWAPLRRRRPLGTTAKTTDVPRADLPGGRRPGVQ